MKLLKKTAIALALSAMSFGAFAMTSIDDAALSQVSGQDGVSIAADLNINIGSFTYFNNKGTANEGSVSFNNIGVRGAFIMTIDVLNATRFNADAVASLAALNGGNVADATTLALATSNALGRTVDATGGGPTAGDVVRFAFPTVTSAETLAHNASMTITVDSITTGHGGGSFGSVQLKNFDLQGTKVWMFGH